MSDDTTLLAFQDELEKIAGAGLGRKVVRKAFATGGEDAAARVISKLHNTRRSWGGSGNAVGSARRAHSRAMTAEFHSIRKAKAKTAGEMTGYTRSGRKPISIEKMLSNEDAVTGLPDEFTEMAEQAAKALVKMSMTPRAKHMALLGAGAAAALTGRQANEDRRVGKLVRKQQAQQ